MLHHVTFIDTVPSFLRKQESSRPTTRIDGVGATYQVLVGLGYPKLFQMLRYPCCRSDYGMFYPKALAKGASFVSQPPGVGTVPQARSGVLACGVP